MVLLSEDKQRPTTERSMTGITCQTAYRAAKKAQTNREYGIPKGMPYLTGWVIHFEIMAEAEVA